MTNKTSAVSLERSSPSTSLPYSTHRLHWTDGSTHPTPAPCIHPCPVALLQMLVSILIILGCMCHSMWVEARGPVSSLLLEVELRSSALSHPASPQKAFGVGHAGGCPCPGGMCSVATSVRSILSAAGSSCTQSWQVLDWGPQGPDRLVPSGPSILGGGERQTGKLVFPQVV